MIGRLKRELLCKFQDMVCEICHKKKKLEDLEIHRINEGYRGGTYTDHRNLKVLCKSCHNILHSNSPF